MAPQSRTARTAPMLPPPRQSAAPVAVVAPAEPARPTFFGVLPSALWTRIGDLIAVTSSTETRGDIAACLLDARSITAPLDRDAAVNLLCLVEALDRRATGLRSVALEAISAEGLPPHMLRGDMRLAQECHAIAAEVCGLIAAAMAQGADR